MASGPLGRRGAGDVIALSTGTHYTEPFAVSFAGCVGMMLKFTDAVSGSLVTTSIQLQGTPVATPTTADDSDWCTYLAKEPDAVNSADVNRGVEVNFTGFLWYRWKIVVASGTGNVQLFYSAKDTK